MVLRLSWKVQGVNALQTAIEQREDGAAVAREARQLGAKLAVAYEVSQAPVITPDPTRGAPLYAQHCSVCHGEAGAGDGPAGVGMTPPPANLRDAVPTSPDSSHRSKTVAVLW